MLKQLKYKIWKQSIKNTLIDGSNRSDNNTGHLRAVCNRFITATMLWIVLMDFFWKTTYGNAFSEKNKFLRILDRYWSLEAKTLLKRNSSMVVGLPRADRKPKAYTFLMKISPATRNVESHVRHHYKGTF